MSVCEHCRIGRLRSARTVYIEWVSNVPLIIPNTPALVCDVCGETEYDVDFLNHVQRLLLASSARLDGPRDETSKSLPSSKRSWLFM